MVLGLGSNLGDRLAHLRAAVEAWAGDVVAVSEVYETAPVGGPEQGAYLNMVLVLRSDLSADDLLARARSQEVAAGRVRDERWGPRTLDVDILWIDGERHDRPELTVPHPRMHERAFVTVPLAEVAPDLVPDRATDPHQEVCRVGPLGLDAPPGGDVPPDRDGDDPPTGEGGR